MQSMVSALIEGVSFLSMVRKRHAQLQEPEDAVSQVWQAGPTLPIGSISESYR